MLDMSTYLVAYVVSDYKMISAMSRTGVRIEVAGKAEQIDQGYGEFALNESIKYIDFLTSYFNVSFPLKKLSIFRFFFIKITIF